MAVGVARGTEVKLCSAFLCGALGWEDGREDFSDMLCVAGIWAGAGGIIEL